MTDVSEVEDMERGGDPRRGDPRRLWRLTVWAMGSRRAGRTIQMPLFWTRRALMLKFQLIRIWILVKVRVTIPVTEPAEPVSMLMGSA